MRNFTRRTSTLPKRGTARWTLVEIALMCVSLLLIVFPLYGEIFRWISPTSVPAAQLETAVPTADGGANNQIVPLATRETFTPEAQTPIINTSTPLVLPTDPPGSTSVPVPTDPPGNTAVPTVPGDTPVPTVPGDTPVPTVPGDTPVPTTEGDTPVPTVPGDTPVPTVAGDTPTPLIGEAPLTIDKVASVSVASVNSEYSYSLSVFGDSASPVSAQVTDELDAQTEFVSANASNGSCSAAGRTVSCTVNVQNNQPVAITIRVRVAASAQSGGRIRNLASVRDNANNAASSDPVFVEISGVGPTLGPTRTPDPNAPTTPPSTVAPTTPPGTLPTTPPGTLPTTPPGTLPTTPPGNPQPTNPPGNPPGNPQPTNPPSGGGGGGGGGNRPTQPVPTAPAPALLPPTPAVGPGAPPAPAQPAPTSRPAGPRATAVPPRQPGVATQAPVARTAAAQTPGAQESTVPTETSTPSAPTQVALDPGLFFRMASDWGSVYPGNDVYYVIALRNNRPADGATLNNLRISSTLPANLEVMSAKADRGDLKQDQNSLVLEVDALKPGQSIEIGVQTRVKQGVAAGTRIISQASAFYDGLALPAYSNIVTVQVVDVVAAGNQPVQPAGTSVVTATSVITTSGAITTTNAITSTADVAAPAAETASPELTATADTPAPTSSPDAASAPTATAAVAGGASDSGSLPPTGSGVPLFGFVLLGMTLMTRTVRLHRAQNRI